MGKSLVITDQTAFPLLLEHKLYEVTGELRNIYEESKKKYTVIICYCGDELAGVVVCDRRNIVNTYVRPKFRKLGIATILIIELRRINKRVLVGSTGYNGFLDFYKRVGILWENKYVFVPRHWTQMYGLSAFGKYRSHIKRNFYNRRRTMEKKFQKEIEHLTSIGAQYTIVDGVLEFSCYDHQIWGNISDGECVAFQYNSHGLFKAKGKLTKLLLKKHRKFCEAQNQKAVLFNVDIRWAPDLASREDVFLVYLEHDERKFVTNIRGNFTFEQVIEFNLNSTPRSVALHKKKGNDIFGTDLKVRSAAYTPTSDSINAAEIKYLAAQDRLYYLLEK